MVGAELVDRFLAAGDCLLAFFGGGDSGEAGAGLVMIGNVVMVCVGGGRMSLQHVLFYLKLFGHVTEVIGEIPNSTVIYQEKVRNN